MTTFNEQFNRILKMQSRISVAKKALEELNEAFSEYEEWLHDEFISTYIYQETRDSLEPVCGECELLMKALNDLRDLYDEFYKGEEEANDLDEALVEAEADPEDESEEEKETTITCILIM